MAHNFFKRIFLNILELVKTVAIVVVVAFVLKTYLIQTFIVEGQSMEPNFKSGEYLLVDKLSYRISQPKRGDVVVFIPPQEQDKNYIKRIIGLPGEEVEISGNNIYVDNININENYLDEENKSKSVGSLPEYKVTLKDSEYFVLGDNRDNSKDSRVIGPVPKENIIGRTFVVLYPVANARIIGHLRYSAIALSAQD